MKFILISFIIIVSSVGYSQSSKSRFPAPKGNKKNISPKVMSPLNSKSTETVVYHYPGATPMGWLELGATSTFTHFGWNGWNQDPNQTVYCPECCPDWTSTFTVDSPDGSVEVGGECEYSHVDMRFPPFGECNVTLTMHGQELGISKAEVVQHGICVWEPTSPGGEPFVQDHTYINSAYFTIKQAYPKAQNCPISGYSEIHPDRKAVEERIPLIGVDFTLVYINDRAWGYAPDRMPVPFENFWNADGWTLSVHHFLNIQDNVTLYMGNGETLPVQFSSYAGKFLVVSPSGSEIFYFDSNGKHLSTANSRTGVIKYTFNYNSNNRLVSVVDYFGNTTTLSRDTNGKLTKITAPYGQENAILTDDWGFITKVSQPTSLEFPDDRSYWVSYHPNSSLMATFLKPGSQMTMFTYDNYGWLSRDAGNGGGFLQILLGANNSVVTETKMSRKSSFTTSTNSTTQISTSSFADPAGMITTSSHSATGINTSNVLGATNVIMISDSQFGSLRKIPQSIDTTIDGVSSTTSFVKTMTGFVDFFNYTGIVETRTTNNRTYSNTYTLSTGMEERTTPEGATVTLKANAIGLPLEFRKGNDQKMQFSYDANGRVTEVKQGAKNKLSYSYYQAGLSKGLIDTVTNQRSEETKFEYDQAGRVVKRILPDLSFVQYSYDGSGNLNGVTPPGRLFHGYLLNDSELLESYSPPDVSGVSPKVTSYGYNDDRQLTSIVKPNGNIATFDYDLLKGLLNFVVTNAGNYTYGYSPSVHGQLDSILSPSGIKTKFEYHGKFVESEESQFNGVMYGKVTLGFDGDHRINARTITDANNISYSHSIILNDDSDILQYGALGIEYEYPSGRIWKTSLDRISDVRSYDPFGNLEIYSIKYTPSIGAEKILYSFTIGRDAMSRINSVSETIQGNTVNYIYEFDLAGRLTKVKKNGTVYAVYEYDSNGNRILQTINGSTIIPIYDAQDRIEAFGGKIFSFDQSGDLRGTKISIGASESFEYDIFGNLIAVTSSSGKSISYLTDGQNRRVGRLVDAQLVQRFLYQGSKISAELNADGSLKSEFMYATGLNSPDYMIKAGVRYRIIANHLGSPRLVVNSLTGEVVQTVDYDVWGKVLRDTNTCFQPFGFAGGLRDSGHNLVRFGARDYDPEVGRWTTKDPVGFGGGQFNLYGYVSNNPVNWTDPSGLVVVDPENLLPDWIINTRIYKELNNSNAVITIRSGDPNANSYGTTLNRSWNGMVQDIILNSPKDFIYGPDNEYCKQLSVYEDTILHEMTHAYSNIGIINTGPVLTNFNEWFDSTFLMPIVFKDACKSKGCK